MSVDKYPDKMAFEDSERSFTYTDLQQAAYHVAGHLIRKKITQKPIAIFMEKNAACVASYFGAAYSGNFYTMLDVAAPAQRISNILRDLEPVIIVTNRKNQAKIEELDHGAEIVLYEEIEEEPYDIEKIRDAAALVKGSDVLYIIYTSGSTGNPKGVVTSHHAVIEYIEVGSVNYLNITDRDVFGNQYPFFYIASLDDIYLPIRNGSSTYIIPPSLFYSPMKLVTFLIEKKINIINWVPSALAIIADCDALNGVDLSCVNKVIFGGESISVSVLNYWRKALPNAVFINGYGATETTNGTSVYIVDREFQENEQIPLGRPMDHVEMILIDENGNEVQQGEIGEIYVRTSSLSYGYYKDLEKTKSVFVQNPVNKEYLDIVYKTGDLARQDQDGNYIFAGRMDTQIKIGGNRVELGDIEKNALEIDEVKECVCLFSKEKEELTLYYRGGIGEKQLYEYLRAKLPVFMIPSRYSRINEFPLNANGKVDKLKLAGLLEE